MVSIDPSQAQPRTQAHAPRAAQANAAQQIPATNFRRHFAIADGDCVFRVLHMDLTNSPGEQASNQRVMELRQTAANYVTEHRQALIAHPSFGGAAGVNDLYDLLVTQGQWNEDAGDLVAPILARVLGRELRILQPAQQAGVYEMNDNRIFRPQDPGLPPGRPDTGQPPIHLLHTGSGTHYEYLESRYPQADATAGSVHTHTRPAAHSVDDLGAPPSPEASPLGRVSPSLWLEEFMRGQKNSPTPGNLSRDSSLRSMSSSGWLDKLAREQGNSTPPGNLSPTFSLDSMSSSGWLNKLASDEENSTPDDVTQPPRKRRRKARLEQQDITVERLTQLPLGNKYVKTQAARNKISNTFNQANDRAFGALTKDKQATEITRISRETGYNRSGVRTTLAGMGNKQIETQVARTEVINAFNQTNSRAFRALTKDEQASEVTRISRKTGYNPSGVRTTLTGEGNIPVTSQVARSKIYDEFTKTNKRAFGALTKDEQASEVARISRETEYTPSGVRTTLTGGGNRRVRTKKARTKISNAFNRTNNRAFGALSQQEQDAEITRISRETGYNQFGVRSTLTGEGNIQVTTQAVRTEIMNAFTQANNRAFKALTQHEQDAEVTRISRKTGYILSGVRNTLTGEGNIKVQSQAARMKIRNAFTQANERAFRELTPHEQDTEVTRISRKTGYLPSGVRKTLTGGGNKL